MPAATYPSLYDSISSQAVHRYRCRLVDAFTARCRVFCGHRHWLQTHSSDGFKPLEELCCLRSSLSQRHQCSVGRNKPLDPFIVSSTMRPMMTDMTLAHAEEYWDNCQNINLKPHFFTAQAVASACVKPVAHHQHVLQLVHAEGGWDARHLAKAGIVGLTRALAAELGPHKIRVNSILPGWVMTQRQIDLWLTPEAEQELLDTQCIKRKLA